VTFLQLKQRWCRRTGKNASSIDTVTGQRAGDYLNEAQRALLSKPGMEPLRRDVRTVASVASTQRYTVPTSGVARINRIWETTNRIKLQRQTLDWLRATDPSPDSGTPYVWIESGTTEVAVQPSDASEVFVDSTSASDTTQIAYIEGVDSLGFRRTASVTLTGTTAVTLSSAITTWVVIDKFYLSAAAAGTVTLHEDASGGTELARIPIGATYAEYTTFLLYPTPSAVVTYYLDVTLGLTDMANDTDRPRLPEDFHDLLLDMAELKEIRKTDDPGRWQMLKDTIRTRTGEFQHWVYTHPDERLVMGPQWAGRSSLGANYPADLWMPN
jgi:hypothetical protein